MSEFHAEWLRSVVRRLRWVRETHGIDVPEIATRIDVPADALKEIEDAPVITASVDFLHRWADALNAMLDERVAA